MKKFKYLFLLGFFILGFNLIGPDFAVAQEKTEIHFFYSVTCPHCAKEKVFLEELTKKYPEIVIKQYEFSAKDTASILNTFYDKYNVLENQKGLVPATFIGDKYFIGFDQEKTAKEIEGCLKGLYENETPQCLPSANNENEGNTTNPEKFKLPFLKEISIDDYSLPALAAILGFFDGFNVCSLGALLLILGIVLVFRSRVKTLIFGLAFIVTTAVVYGILIFIWHKIFISLSQFISKMEIFVGVLALAGAIYFLWQFIKTKKYGPVCNLENSTSKLSQKLQNIFQNKSNIFILTGAILIFATVVTLVEFPCSAVLPVLFASVISKANISTELSYLYIGIFLFFYMLDEIIVFLIAFFTLKIWVSSPKFTVWLNFAAFITLLFLSVYYLLI